MNNGTATMLGDAARHELVDRGFDVGAGRHAEGDFRRHVLIDAARDILHAFVPLRLPAVGQQQDAGLRGRLPAKRRRGGDEHTQDGAVQRFHHSLLSYWDQIISMSA